MTCSALKKKQKQIGILINNLLVHPFQLIEVIGKMHGIKCYHFKFDFFA